MDRHFSASRCIEGGLFPSHIVFNFGLLSVFDKVDLGTVLSDIFGVGHLPVIFAIRFGLYSVQSNVKLDLATK